MAPHSSRALRSAPDASVGVSLILGVRDEEDTVGLRARQVADHVRALGKSFELLAVNDGCFDTSFAVLRLLGDDLPELKLMPAYAAERAFLRGAAAAEAPHMLLCHGSRRPALGPVGWALRQLEQGADAVIARGHWIAARRLSCFGVLARAGGRGDAFERRFEREAAGLRVTVVGSRTAASTPPSWLEPVLRLLSA